MDLRARTRKQKYIPVYGQNVLTLEPLPGMENTLNWLKTEKLHKYWPTISRLTYHQLLMLDSTNWELTLSCVGVRPHTITTGAKERLLRLTSELRNRSTLLKEVYGRGNLNEIVDCLFRILCTPLANQPELDGEELIPLVQLALTDVQQKATRQSCNRNIISKVDRLTKMFQNHPSIK